MPFFNQGKPFIGPTENPLVKSVFVRGAGDGNPLPPPGTDFMITEITEIMMISEIGDLMITE